MNTETRTYDVLHDGKNAAPIKMWTRGVPVDEASKGQLLNTASMPFIYKWLAVMPDVHFGKGSTIGSVIPTKGAIIPAAVGVDIGCGMMAVRTSLDANDLPDSLGHVRAALEQAVPPGRTPKRDKGAWQDLPSATEEAWAELLARFKVITDKHPKIANANTVNHLGTLGPRLLLHHGRQRHGGSDTSDLQKHIEEPTGVSR
jgi:tRNA-splicing ligase RtcB